MSDKMDKRKKKNEEASSSSSDDSSSVSSDEVKNFSLKINKSFADSFNERKRRQELSKIESQKKEKMFRGLVDELDDDEDDDSEEDESEDDIGEELDEETDFNIHKTIEMIRNKDTKIYDKNFVAFEKGDDDSSGDDDDDDGEGKEKKKKKEKLTYSKMMADTMKKKGAEGLVKEEEDDEDEDNDRRAKSMKKFVYNKEQEEAKKKFKEELEKSMKEGDNENEDEDDDEDEDEDLLVRKKVSKELASEKEDKKKAKLKELVQNSKINDDDEKFLQWYVLEQPWKQFKAPGYKEGMELYKPQIEDDDDNEEEDKEGNENGEDEEDLEELEKAEEFESKYNFRFEEEGGTHLVFHSRIAIEGTMRRKDDSRKKKREQHKKAKEEEKRLKLEELKRLKNLKRKILEDRLKSASIVAGVDLSNVKKGKKDKKKKQSKDDEGDGNNRPVGFTPEDLDEDFDPEKWDAKMNAIFNSDYYDKELEEDEKERVRPIHAGSDSDDDSKDREDEADGKEEEGDNNDEGPKEEVNKKEKKKMKKSKGEQINEIEEAAKTSDINVDDILKIEKDIEEGLNKLDFEGIAGGMPTRFKYVSVKPESYGLTTEEILETDNKLLNQLVSLRQLAPYRDKEFQVSSKRRNKFRKLARQMQATGGYISEKFANKHGFTLKADKTPKEILEKVNFTYTKQPKEDEKHSESKNKKNNKRELEGQEKSNSNEPKDKKHIK